MNSLQEKLTLWKSITSIIRKLRETNELITFCKKSQIVKTGRNQSRSGRYGMETIKHPKI